MYVGSLRLDLLLGDIHSLKQKRSVLRPIVAELRRRFEVNAAEPPDAPASEVGVCLVAADHRHCARCGPGGSWPIAEPLAARQGSGTSWTSEQA
jgi:uncharacterized protein YlxP (DUF503 family)